MFYVLWIFSWVSDIKYENKSEMNPRTLETMLFTFQLYECEASLKHCIILSSLVGTWGPWKRTSSTINVYINASESAMGTNPTQIMITIYPSSSLLKHTLYVLPHPTHYHTSLLTFTKTTSHLFGSIHLNLGILMSQFPQWNNYFKHNPERGRCLSSISFLASFLLRLIHDHVL